MCLGTLATAIKALRRENNQPDMYFGMDWQRRKPATLQDNKVSFSLGGPMRHFRLVAFALFLLGFSLPLLAQHGAKSSGNPPATPSSNESSGNTNEAAGGHREPCWKVAGIAPA